VPPPFAGRRGTAVAMYIGGAATCARFGSDLRPSPLSRRVDHPPPACTERSRGVVVGNVPFQSAELLTSFLILRFSPSYVNVATTTSAFVSPPSLLSATQPVTPRRCRAIAIFVSIPHASSRFAC